MIPGAPHETLTFDEQGHPGSASEYARIVQALGSGYSDVIVFAHGWNNSTSEATNLFAKLFDNVTRAMGGSVPSGRRLATVGVYWPSKAFSGEQPPEMGGTASLELTADLIRAGAEMRDLKPLMLGRENDLEEMARLLETAPQDNTSIDRFVTLLKAVTTRVESPTIEDDHELGMLELSTDEILKRLPSSAGADAGGAAGLGDFFTGAWNKLKDFFRMWTFWEMKKRAGVVGSAGLGPFLVQLASATKPPRVHLVGHSFGARLISFALREVSAAKSTVASVTLIQGAFSHYCFTNSLPFDAAHGGALAGQEGKVAGPIFVTHCVHDTANCTWYPLGCSLSGDATSEFVDKAKFGAMGADGAQGVGAVEVVLGPVGTAYPINPHGFVNLNADATFKPKSAFSGAHSDIYYDSVGWVIVYAAGLKPGTLASVPALPGEAGGGPAMLSQSQFTPGGGSAGFRARIVSSAVDLSDGMMPMMIELNLDYPGGVEAAHRALELLLAPSAAAPGQLNRIGRVVYPYVEVRMTSQEAAAVARKDVQDAAQGVSDARHGARAIHHVWPDFTVKLHIDQSISTIKADAFHRTFQAYGERTTWGVVDSGIDSRHPHFSKFGNLCGAAAEFHCDFTQGVDPATASAQARGGLVATALQDEVGHGTHVAGILAGGLPEDGVLANGDQAVPIVFGVVDQDDGAVRVSTREVPAALLRGVAPRARLVSLKVIGQGAASNRTFTVLQALRYLHETVNRGGRELRVQGVNISLGYEFDPRWFACGRSPLCVEVEHLVRAGVVVVVSSGNTGFGAQTSAERTTNTGLTLTINDPGNAELAITVGSTHREKPYVYGVSYFSSKGPTGDGRQKPDLVAPGERITSCATGTFLKPVANQLPPQQPSAARQAIYVEQSGTSMAAAHVSGAAAALLSLRREFVGKPDEIKRVLLKAASTLGRTAAFEGAGLLDLLRATESI